MKNDLFASNRTTQKDAFHAKKIIAKLKNKYSYKGITVHFFVKKTNKNVPLYSFIPITLVS